MLFMYNPVILIPFLIWSIIWKGLAMWKAARNNHKTWFIVFLILNLVAIPEILYLIFWANPKPVKNKKK